MCFCFSPFALRPPPIRPLPPVRSPSYLLSSSPSCTPHFPSATVCFLRKLWTHSEGEQKQKEDQDIAVCRSSLKQKYELIHSYRKCDRNLTNLYFVRDSLASALPVPVEYVPASQKTQPVLFLELDSVRICLE